MLRPGATIGILGGGQLGRMLAQAAATLGFRVHVFTPEQDSPAAQVAASTTVATYGDEAALAAFAAKVDAVTLEFENIPVATIEYLAARVPVRPGAAVLRLTQDRVLEKEFANRIGAGTAPFRAVASLVELEAGVRDLGLPCILKTRRFGYDGKGQAKLREPADIARAWQDLGSQPCILEGLVDFACEASVIVARNTAGEVRTFVPVENRHENHILATTLAPGGFAAATAEAADDLARRIARELDLNGLLAVELFVTRDGDVLVNELAPRVHNSGHWTIEGCCTSQFEQAIRAAADWPLGDPAPIADAIMRNLIGDDVAAIPTIVTDPRAKLHLYGKTEARPGRKMGHVTWLFAPGTRPSEAPYRN